MSETPVSLLEDLRRPDARGAWDRFVELYTPFLAHCVGSLGLQHSDQADLLQDVFLTLYRKLPEFAYDEGKSFRAWLRTLVVNHWRDFLRKRGRTPQSPGGARLDEQPESDTIAAFAEQEYRRYLVERALQLMRSDFEESTWRACWENVVAGRPALQVGRELGMTPDAVYAATYRVLRRLRQELQGLLE